MNLDNIIPWIIFGTIVIVTFVSICGVLCYSRGSGEIKNSDTVVEKDDGMVEIPLEPLPAYKDIIISRPPIYENDIDKN